MHAIHWAGKGHVDEACANGSLNHKKLNERVQVFIAHQMIVNPMCHLMILDHTLKKIQGERVIILFGISKQILEYDYYQII